MARSLPRCAVTAALCLVSVLAACHGAPPPLTAADPPQLHEIQRAFVRVVEATESGEASWHSGWHGNVMVNVFGGRNQGLCWQWQQMVYEGVVNTVGAVGWDATGVALDTGTGSEHHAVLVWDPRKIKREDILTARRPRPVWVLDGWRRGAPDIWQIDQWIDSCLSAPETIELEKLWPRGQAPLH